MSTHKPTAGTVLPDTFGTARIIDCGSCGRLEFSARELDRFKRMREFHRTLCSGEVSTHRPSSRGPTA